MMTDQDWLNCVGPGWHPIVRPLLDKAREQGVEVHQVKEKFGGLRFYTGPASEEFYQVIEQAEHKSMNTCEECGVPGVIRGRYWLRCLCDTHHVEQVAKDARRGLK